jgi:23S rRNA (cytidine1920-2'-O)/16S rRNA (cytidine1409-2'-O)-methyltransferase
MAGQVTIGPGRRRAQKPGELVDPLEPLSVAERPAFVSRGGIKLANALTSSGLEVTGRRALDVGASTGGFTDCMLQRGAREVIAVDVGYGTLDYRLRTDPRVRVLERTNARALTPAMLSSPRDPEDEAVRPARGRSRLAEEQELPDLATIDVSFISLTKVLAPVLGCLSSGHDVLALIKPQFEVGRGRVGKGGVVREAHERRAALVSVGEAAVALGALVRGYHPSGLPGPKGNLETFIHLADASSGEQGARTVEELERLARIAEPA